MPLDPRWKPVPTFWLLTCQLICATIVLGVSAYDINYVRTQIVARPSKRLVLNITCSTFSALSTLTHLGLFIKSRLHPLFSIALSTAISFFWLSVCFYQSIAIADLKSIFDMMCPRRFKDKWIYCQNPKFTFTFSVLAVVVYGVFIVYACVMYRKAARFKTWYKLSFGRREGDDASVEDLLPLVGGSTNGGTRLGNLCSQG